MSLSYESTGTTSPMETRNESIDQPTDRMHIVAIVIAFFLGIAVLRYIFVTGIWYEKAYGGSITCSQFK